MGNHPISNMPVMSDDLPIESKDEDLYNRAGIAASVSNAISKVWAKESFVVGVSGDWGSGKSSLLNMVAECLKQEKNGVHSVLRFEPWLYSSEEDLLESLFNLLKSGIRGDRIGEQKAKRLSALLSRYALSVIGPLTGDLVQLIAMMFAIGNPVALALMNMLPQLVSSAADCASDQADESSDATLEQLRVELCEELIDLDGNIVVLVDDLDRLEDEKLRLIFKLVTLTASFSRIVYVLSYDKRVVEGALSELQSGVSNDSYHGSRYLEKIIQLPVEVPPLDRKRMADYLISRTIDILGDDTLLLLNAYGENRRFQAVVSNLILPLISTPRDVVRYLNQLRWRRLITNDEIVPSDLAGMTAIHVLLPDLSDWIWENRGFVCGASTSSISFEAQQGLQDALGSHRESDVLTLALVRLFPALESLLLKSYNLFAATHYYDRVQGRIRSPELLSLFYGKRNDGSLSRPEYLDLLNSMSEEEVLAFCFGEANQGYLGEFVSLIEETANKLSVKRLKMLVGVIFRCLGLGDNNVSAMIATGSVDEKIAEAIETISMRIGVNAVSDEIDTHTDALSFSALKGAVFLLRDDQLAREENTVHSLSDGCYQKLALRFVSESFSNWDIILNETNHITLTMWKRLDNDFNLGTYRNFLDSVQNNPELLLLYNASMLDVMRDIGGGNEEFSLGLDCLPGYTPEWEKWSNSKRFSLLSLYSKVKCAAFCLLKERYGLDDLSLAGRVSADEACNLVEAR